MISPTGETACGTVSIGSWPHDRIGEDTALQVDFEVPFDIVPGVVVLLAAIDAQSPTHKRIDTWVSDVTRENFRLHVRTWADSITWMVKVTWIASSDHAQVRLGLKSASDVTQNADLTKDINKLVKFPTPFPCRPDVALGLSGLDASGAANLCVLAETQGVGSRDFNMECMSWQPDSIAWKTNVAWVACSSPAALQTGVQAFGSGPAGITEDPIVEGDARCIDVWFPRSFDHAPSVALALVGLDAVQHKPLRIDTWTCNITHEGFRLNVRTWENSIINFVKVAWVATASSLNITLHRLAPHSPPKEYVVQGFSLGQGVMGVTHRTKHKLDGQIYAVKTCKHPYVDHKESLNREISNLASLPRHPNLLRYYTSVLESDRLHIVTEYLDAFKFAELLPAPDGDFLCKHHPNAVLKWLSQLLDGLAHMHSAGITHRDLHNENVMVLRDPHNMKRPSQGSDAIRIIDFGAGKVSDLAFEERFMSQTAGHAHYASPERRSGRPFNDRDDVWAAGCHLLELYTGKSIRNRSCCGSDGMDFATTPKEVRRAIQECGNVRCRETAEYILIFDVRCRPSAASARDYARVALRPPTPAPPVWVTVERPALKRPRSNTGGGGRRTRPCRATVCLR